MLGALYGTSQVVENAEVWNATGHRISGDRCIWVQWMQYDPELGHRQCISPRWSFQHMDARRSTWTEDHTSTHLSTLDRRPVTKGGCPAKWFSCEVPSGFNARQACSNATLPSGDHDDMFRGSSSLCPTMSKKVGASIHKTAWLQMCEHWAELWPSQELSKQPRPPSTNYDQLCIIMYNYVI